MKIVFTENGCKHDFKTHHADDNILICACCGLIKETKMKIFDTYEEVEGSFNCRKLPIIMKAKQMDCEFRVNSLEGDYCQGKAGDYLMTGTKGEHWIIDKEIFEETYEVLR